MHFCAYLPLLAFALCVAAVFADGVVNASPSTPDLDLSTAASYQPQDPRTGYVAHESYPYDYNTAAGPAYAGAPYPGLGHPVNLATPHSTSLSPVQESLQIALKFFAKVGLFLAGGVVLLFVGGLFTTAVCSITPLCEITFPSIGTFGSSRSLSGLMTPEKLSTAAALVQDALGKYQRLQRAAN